MLWGMKQVLGLVTLSVAQNAAYIHAQLGRAAQVKLIYSRPTEADPPSLAPLLVNLKLEVAGNKVNIEG